MFRHRLSDEPDLPAVNKKSGHTYRLPSPPASSQAHQNASSSPSRVQDYHPPKTRRSSKQQLASKPKREPDGETNNLSDTDLELSLKIDDSTIPRRSPRRRGTDFHLQSVPNEPSEILQHPSTNNIGGRALPDSDAVQLLEILHQSRDKLLVSSVSGTHPDRDFWASCLAKVNEKLGRRVFATWSDLKSWVKAHSIRQREKGIMQAPQPNDSSAKQTLIYEWLWYWTYWELMVHAARFHGSIIEVFGRGKLMQMFQKKYNVTQGEQNFMPFILGDVVWGALESRKKRLERPFRKTRSYSQFPGESEEEDRVDEDDGDSSEEWTPSMEDPNPLTSIETENSQEDGGEERQGNNDGNGQDDAEQNFMLGTQPTPNTTQRRLQYYEGQALQNRTFRPANHSEVSRYSSPLPAGLDTPEVFREHFQERLHPSEEERPRESGGNGADDIGGLEDWRDQNANCEPQREQLNSIKDGLVEYGASTTSPPPSGDLSMIQQDGGATSTSPSPELVTSDILPPRPFAELLGSPVPHNLSANRQDVSSPNPFDDSDDPFDDSHDLALSRFKSRRPQSLVRTHANSARCIPTRKIQEMSLNHSNRGGTPFALRQENEAHARKQSTRVRTSFVPVGQLKALLVPHTIHNTATAQEEPRASYPETTQKEISTRMFYGSPAARWPVTRNHFQFMGTHIRFADDSEHEQGLRAKSLVQTGQEYGVETKDTSLTRTTPRSLCSGSIDDIPVSSRRAKALKEFNGSASSTVLQNRADYDDDDEDIDAILPPLEAIFRNKPRASPQMTANQLVLQNLSSKQINERNQNQNDKRQATDLVDNGQPTQNEPPLAPCEQHQLKTMTKVQGSKLLFSSSTNASDGSRPADGPSLPATNVDSHVALGAKHDSRIGDAAKQPAQETPRGKKSRKPKGAKRKRSQSNAREAVNKQVPEVSGPNQDAPAINTVKETSNTHRSKRQRAESRLLNQSEPSSTPPKPFGQSSKKRGKKIFQEVTPSPVKPGGYSTPSETTKSLPQSYFGASLGGSCPKPTSRISNWSRSAVSESSPREELFASPFANERTNLSSSVDTFLGESISLSSQHVIEHRSSYHNPTPAQEPSHHPEPRSSPSMMQHTKQSDGHILSGGFAHTNNRRSEPCTPQPRTSSSTGTRPTSGLFIRSNSNRDNRYRSTPYSGSPSNKNTRRNNNRGRNSFTQQSRYQRSMTVDTNTALLNATPGSRHLGETIVQMEARLRDIRRHGETLVLMEAELQDMKRQFRRMNSNR